MALVETVCRCDTLQTILHPNNSTIRGLLQQYSKHFGSTQHLAAKATHRCLLGSEDSLQMPQHNSHQCHKCFPIPHSRPRTALNPCRH